MIFIKEEKIQLQGSKYCKDQYLRIISLISSLKTLENTFIDKNLRRDIIE